MEPRKDDKSLGELFSELSRDTAELVRKEVQLARTELTARASRVGRHVVYIAIGGFIAYAGVLALVAALVIVLEAIGPHLVGVSPHRRDRGRARGLPVRAARDLGAAA